ncbi:MAG TPA: hypothetical protein PKC40_00115 [Saprospiraceae bacterium]|nr:hypothetical protein [Saprospiraceae bacterium]
MYKTAFLITGFLICVSQFGFTQPGRTADAEERIEAIRVAYITDRLRLTPEESQQFWPVFNQFEDDQKKLRNSFKNKKDIPNMSDAEAEEFVKMHLDLEQKELDLKRTYFEKLKKILPPRKLAMLGMAERQFKAKLLEHLRERRAGRRFGE